MTLKTRHSEIDKDRTKRDDSDVLPRLSDDSPAEERTPATDAGGSDDTRVLYFRDLVGASPMPAPEERVAALQIVALDVTRWEKLLERPAGVQAVTEAVTPLVETVPRELQALARAQGSKPKATARRALLKAARALRALDLDRDLIAAATAAVLAGLRGRPGDEARATEIRASQRAADAAHNEFARRNLRLVVAAARRYRVAGLSFLDLVQEGNLGLLKAVNRFDPERGLRFSTFAVWWIRHHINRALADKAPLVRVPVHWLESRSKVTHARNKLHGQLGRDPSAEEIAEVTGLTVAKVAQASAPVPGHTVSLDAALVGDDGDDRSFHDRFQDPHADVDSPIALLSKEADLAQLRQAMGRLPTVEAEILRKRFGMDTDQELTLAEIGQERGLSRERIRQIEAQAIRRLRSAMAAAESGKKPGLGRKADRKAA